MFLLLRDPEQLAAVRADRSLVPGAIEESLRLEQPLAQIGRIATGSCPVQGTAIPAGTLVEVSAGAANRDPGFWPDPDAFDVRRSRSDRHLSFGSGVHRSSGSTWPGRSWWSCSSARSTGCRGCGSTPMRSTST